MPERAVLRTNTQPASHLFAYSHVGFTKIVEEMEIGWVFIIFLITLLDGESFAVSAINVNERKRAVNFMHILLGSHSIPEIISRNSGWNANRLN